MQLVPNVPALAARKVYFHLLHEDFRFFLQKAFLELYGVQMDWNWHHGVICDDLMASYEGRRRRLIINVPPRSLKSFICSVAYPAWVMGRNPRAKIIGVSYALELATKFSREQRALMQCSWYHAAFPETRLSPTKSKEIEFETTKGGFRLATSTGGVLTGRGADIIIVDDPMKPQDALSDSVRNTANGWIDSTLMTRLDDEQRGQMIVIMQRLHEQDSTGHLLEKGGWTHRSFPAIAQAHEEWRLNSGQIIHRKAGGLLHAAREPQSVLDTLQRDLGNMHFSAQFLQMPLPPGGNLVKREWFQYEEGSPELDPRRIIISVDTAMKGGAHNDWTVMTVWLMQRERYSLLHLVREKMDFPRLRTVLLELREQFKARLILMEDTGAGTSLAQQLQQERTPCLAIKPNGSKVERLQSASIAFERGFVFFPKAAHWLDELEKELLGFPGARHDDQVDSVSQFLNWAMTGGQKFGSSRFAR